MNKSSSSISQSFILLKLALIITSLFTLTHLCGGQTHVSVLAGVHAGSMGQAFMGFLYVGAYLLTISMVPILLIAALVLSLTEIPKTHNRSMSY